MIKVIGDDTASPINIFIRLQLHIGGSIYPCICITPEKISMLYSLCTRSHDIFKSDKVFFIYKITKYEVTKSQSRQKNHRCGKV